MSASSTKPAALALLALAFLSSACQFNVGTVEAHLVYTNNKSQDPFDPDTVRRLRVRIEGDDMDTQETKFSLLDGDGKALNDVPLGKNRVLTVEGLDEPGYVQSRGVSTPFTTKSGRTKVYIYFSLVEKFSEPPFGVQEDEWRENFKTDMPSGRVFHTSTLLPDGTVLVAGGSPAFRPGDFLGRLDDADPTIMRFKITPCAFIQEKDSPECGDDGGKLCMHKQGGRAHHTADLLPGGTHVVVAGGEPVDNLWQAEYYSIEARSFTSNINMRSRTRHASAVLTGSRQGVLVAGGEGSIAWEVLEHVELFEAGMFEPQSNLALSKARTGAVAVSYPDHVLVVGGWEASDQASKVVDHIRFDTEPPSTKPLELNQERAGHTAVLVDVDGSKKVFVCGGVRYDQGVPVLVETCELLDPLTGRSEDVPGVSVRRWSHTATVLQDGRVLLAGGFDTYPPTAAKNSAVLFDTPVGSGGRQNLPMVSMRAGHTATLLSNGMVVLIGGISDAGTVSPASLDYEIFNPRPR